MATIEKRTAVISALIAAVALFVSVPGSWYTYLSYQLSLTQAERERLKEEANERREREEAARQKENRTSVQKESLPPKGPRLTSSSQEVAPSVLSSDPIEAASSELTRPATSVSESAPPLPARPARKTQSDSEPLKPVALSTLPAPLGPLSKQEPPSLGPREDARREPSNGAPTIRLVTAIEGEEFLLCGQPEFTISIWSPRPNAPVEASLRKRGMVMADGLSTRLVRGKPKTIVENCDVTFVELRSGFKPIAVLEERRKED